MSTPESKVKAKVVAVLKKAKAWYCFPSTHGFGRSGVPDILVCYKGRFLGIEVKATEKNLPTALQTNELVKIKDAGGTALVVNADNMAGLHYIFPPDSNI